MKWENVTCSKAHEGLNIRKIKVMKYYLLLKWWWRYGVEREAIWRRLIISKYGHVTSHWLPKREVSRGVSKIWKNIISVGLRNETIFSIFLNGSKILIGRGINIFFWMDL